MSMKTSPLRRTCACSVPSDRCRQTSRLPLKLNHCHAEVVSPGCCLRMCCPIRDEIIVVTSCARSRLDIPDGCRVRVLNHCGDFLLALTLGHSRCLNVSFVTETIAVTSCVHARLDIPDG